MITFLCHHTVRVFFLGHFLYEVCHMIVICVKYLNRICSENVTYYHKIYILFCCLNVERQIATCFVTGVRGLINSKFGVIYSQLFESDSQLFEKTQYKCMVKLQLFLEGAIFTPIFKMLVRALGGADVSTHIQPKLIGIADY